jgi:hypothetical protein
MDNYLNYIIIAVLAVIAGLIVWYLLRAKKSGQTCIGCPDAKNCGGMCNCSRRAGREEKK